MDGARGGYGRGERSDNRRRDEDRERHGHRSRDNDRNSYRSSRDNDRNSYRSSRDYDTNGDRSRSRNRDESSRDSRGHRYSRDDDRREHHRRRGDSLNGRGREDRYSNHAPQPRLTHTPPPQLTHTPPPVAPVMGAAGGIDAVDAFVGDRGFGGGFVDRGPGYGRGGGNNGDRGLGGEPFGSGSGSIGGGPSGGDSGGGRGGGRGGRGGGRGRGAGGRPGRSARERRQDSYDLVESRPTTLTAKQAVLGTSKQVHLRSNFYRVDSRPNWAIFHYRVDFLPEETDTRVKKRLVRGHAAIMGAYIFDGSSLYVSQRLTPDPMILQSTQENGEAMQLTIRLVAELRSTDIMYLQIFNIIVRKCLESMQLEEMGRHYYDRRQAIRIDAHHLELWPGYKTSMRNHEHDILLGVEITHKVLRLDSCLTVINQLRHRPDGQKKIHDDLIGCIVMTTYNRKTYRVDDIDFKSSPQSTFDMQGRQISFADYFREKYNIFIRDIDQPLLLSRPKKKDFHRGMSGPILLIPELCQMTGLTDEMRSNNQLMRALSTHLHTDPSRRMGKLRDFIQSLTGNVDIRNELTRWGLRFQQNLVEFNGHVIPKENILLGESQVEVPNDKYDWSQAFRSKPMLTTVNLINWVIIVPSRDSNVVDKLVNNMQRVARPLKFLISSPKEVRRINETRPGDYANTVDSVMGDYRQLDMIFVILPKQTNDIYSAVKKRTCMLFGVPSQCFVAKNAYNDRGLMSICTKLVVQMNAKLGGEPWKVNIPLKNLMIVGFDAYHCGKRKGSSVGAMTATTSGSLGRYYSTISFHSSRDDLSEKMGADFTKCLHAYRNVNKTLPGRIIMYRDGVGDGQLKYVYETELEEIQKQLKVMYEGAGLELPKFTFIVVTKRINTRIFAADGNRPVNPEPGTVADDVITLPERYDFYLVAQFTRQGTVSPVSYNVLRDTSGLDADKMQKLTFKLCHLYFNWSGTVTVPAPCQYAHKLAYLTGLSLGGSSNEKLSDKLYYL